MTGIPSSLAVSDVLDGSQLTSGISDYQATGFRAPADDSDDNIGSFVSASEYPLRSQPILPATSTVQQDPSPGIDRALSFAPSSRSPSNYQATVHTASSGDSNCAPASTPTEQPSVAPGQVPRIDMDSQCSVPPLSASAIDSSEHPTAAVTVEPVRHRESSTSEPATGWRPTVPDWRKVRHTLGGVSFIDGTMGSAASKVASVRRVYDNARSAARSRYEDAGRGFGSMTNRFTSRAGEAYQSVPRVPRVHPSNNYSKGTELLTRGRSKIGDTITLRNPWKAAPPELVKQPSLFEAISSRARSAYYAGDSRSRKEDIPEEEKSGWLSYLTGSSRAPVQPETISKWSSFSLRRKPVETAPRSGQSWISLHTPSIKSIIPPSWTGDEVAEVMTADDSWMSRSRGVVDSAMGSVSAQSQAMSEYIQKQTDRLKEYTGITKPAPEPESSRWSRWRSRGA